MIVLPVLLSLRMIYAVLEFVIPVSDTDIAWSIGNEPAGSMQSHSDQ